MLRDHTGTLSSPVEALPSGTEAIAEPSSFQSIDTARAAPRVQLLPGPGRFSMQTNVPKPRAEGSQVPKTDAGGESLARGTANRGGGAQEVIPAETWPFC